MRKRHKEGKWDKIGGQNGRQKGERIKYKKRNTEEEEEERGKG